MLLNLRYYTPIPLHPFDLSLYCSPNAPLLYWSMAMLHQAALVLNQVLQRDIDSLLPSLMPDSKLCVHVTACIGCLRLSSTVESVPHRAKWLDAESPCLRSVARRYTAIRWRCSTAAIACRQETFSHCAALHACFMQVMRTINPLKSKQPIAMRP